MPTEKQVRFIRFLLEELGEFSDEKMAEVAALSVPDASALITELEKRRDEKDAAPKQAQVGEFAEA